MSKILELREKRAKAWEAAKKFLDSKRGEDGLLSAEDTAAYEKMEKEVVDLGIIIQKSVAGNDRAGNHILSWQDYFACHAYVNNLSGKEYWEAAQLNAEKEVFFLIRYCSEVKEIDTEHFRILFRGQVYNITFIDNVKYQNKTIKLRAALEKRGGITGTSISKRKNFVRMMEDAKDGHFDLIVTREVSRFARNTVDTLQQTRLLKRMGIEVYFTEDGIWTMNDEDGELRLTIMATLAQNESKKTSMRVKAGQMVSFQNGVVYGTGNVLGYDKVGPEYVINEEQAETVRRIFDLYLAGNGYHKIMKQLEKEGRHTAMGKTMWHYATVGHILKNRLYCGELE